MTKLQLECHGFNYKIANLGDFRKDTMFSQNSEDIIVSVKERVVGWLDKPRSTGNPTDEPTSGHIGGSQTEQYDNSNR